MMLVLALAAMASGFQAGPSLRASPSLVRRQSSVVAGVDQLLTVTSAAPAALSSADLTLLVAAAPEWVAPVSAVLDPLLFLAQFMMLGRVLLSWYPDINVNKVPYNFIAW